MNIEWNSEETRGDYPITWNIPNFRRDWTASEELIIQRCKAKMLERAQTERLMPRERLHNAMFGHDLDRLPFEIENNQPVMIRALDSFGETPSIIHVKDLYNFPELDIITYALYYSRFLPDFTIKVAITYGEDVLTKKFRVVEHGPVLAVEGVAKTKEDMEWFMDNIPDPALRGVYPIYMWECRQLLKWFPEIPQGPSACAGTLASATFLRGVRDFLMDMRKRPELGELAIKAAHKYFLKKVDRILEVIGPQFAPDNPNGNILYWCDGGAGYLNIDEFTRTFHLHIGDAIKYCSRKNVRPLFFPVGSKAQNVVVLKALDESLGGIMGEGDNVPPLEEFFEVFETRNKQADKISVCNVATGKVVLEGEEAMRRDVQRYVDLFSKTPEKGLRVIPATGGIDSNATLTNIDIQYKLHHEMLKYPLSK